MTHARNHTLRVGALARVEGEGAMLVRARGGRVERVELQIYEPPRFFEAFLRGRGFTEAPDITARICGICPVAYQMSACNAMEDACGVAVSPQIRDLRRLLYCGEWIESHALHIFLLHAPDFLGYPSAIAMAADHRDLIEMGLRIKKAGNEILRTVGGRSIHPINVRVGGFYRAPTRHEIGLLAEPLRRARDEALTTVRWTAGLEFPDFEQDYLFVGLRHPTEYAVVDGRLAIGDDLEVDVSAFDEHIVEEQVQHSNALHARLRDGRRFMVGPLARYALSRDKLAPIAREAASEAGLGRVCRNPFRSIVVRAVELLHACDEATRLIEGYEEPERPAVEVPPRTGTGHGATEAPRGTLYHRYAIAADGEITEARIVPPTSQNQSQIEDDLRAFVEPRLDLSHDELTHSCEQAIRNYDPCISCATHFLDLRVENL
ncbi:MAG: Ni/Fe hydrogenase subunit alpha [Actinomycetota bacterium]